MLAEWTRSDGYDKCLMRLTLYMHHTRVWQTFSVNWAWKTQVMEEVSRRNHGLLVLTEDLRSQADKYEARGTDHYSTDAENCTDICVEIVIGTW